MTLMNWPEMASTGEAILFGCVAVFMIACALGVLFFKKAVHCAICMVGVMLGLAVLYLMHGAAFLGTVPGCPSTPARSWFSSFSSS